MSLHMYVNNLDPLGGELPDLPDEAEVNLPFKLPAPRVEPPAVTEKSVITIKAPEVQLQPDEVPLTTRPRWNYMWIYDQDANFRWLVESAENYWTANIHRLWWYPWRVGGIHVFSGQNLVWPLRPEALATMNSIGVAIATLIIVYWSWLAGYDLVNVPFNLCGQYWGAPEHAHLQVLMDHYRRSVYTTNQLLQWSLVANSPNGATAELVEIAGAAAAAGIPYPPFAQDDSGYAGYEGSGGGGGGAAGGFAGLGGGADVSQAILGGENAAIEEWPWVVALGRQRFPGSFLYSREVDEIPLTSCGGTVIDANWVVTAAHCIGNLLDMYWVTAGVDCRPELGGIHQPGAQVRFAARIYQRESWPRYLNQEPGWMMRNILSIQYDQIALLPVIIEKKRWPPTDVALLRLNAPLNLGLNSGHRVEAIRRHTSDMNAVERPNFQNPMILSYAGWGYSGNRGTGQLSLRLQKISFRTTVFRPGLSAGETFTPYQRALRAHIYQTWHCTPISPIGCWFMKNHTVSHVAPIDSGSGIIWQGGGGAQGPQPPLLVGVLSATKAGIVEGGPLPIHGILERRLYRAAGYNYLSLFPWLVHHAAFVNTTMAFDGDPQRSGSLGTHLYRPYPQVPTGQFQGQPQGQFEYPPQGQ